MSRSLQRVQCPAQPAKRTTGTKVGNKRPFDPAPPTTSATSSPESSDRPTELQKAFCRRWPPSSPPSSGSTTLMRRTTFWTACVSFYIARQRSVADYGPSRHRTGWSRTDLPSRSRRLHRELRERCARRRSYLAGSVLTPTSCEQSNLRFSSSSRSWRNSNSKPRKPRSSWQLFPSPSAR